MTKKSHHRRLNAHPVFQKKEVDDSDDNTTGGFAESTEESPLSVKRVGNYSPYPKFLTCDAKITVLKIGIS